MEEGTNFSVDSELALTEYHGTPSYTNHDILLQNLLDQNRNPECPPSSNSDTVGSRIQCKYSSYQILSESKRSIDDRCDSTGEFVQTRPPSSGDPQEIAAFWSARLDRLILDPQEPRSNTGHTTVPDSLLKNDEGVLFEDNVEEETIVKAIKSAFRPICYPAETKKSESYIFHGNNFYAEKDDNEEETEDECLIPVSAELLLSREHSPSDEELQIERGDRTYIQVYKDHDDYRGIVDDGNRNVRNGIYHNDEQYHQNLGEHNNYSNTQSEQEYECFKLDDHCNHRNAVNHLLGDANTTTINTPMVENVYFDTENKRPNRGLESLENRSYSEVEARYLNSAKNRVNQNEMIKHLSSDMENHSTCEVRSAGRLPLEVQNRNQLQQIGTMAFGNQNMEEIESPMLTDINQNKSLPPELNEVEFHKGIVCSEVSSAQDILTTRYRLGNIGARRARCVITWSRWNISQVVRSPDGSSPTWKPLQTESQDDSASNINYINEGIERREAAIRRLVSRRADRPQSADTHRQKPPWSRRHPETIPETDEWKYEETSTPTSYGTALNRFPPVQSSVSRDEIPPTAPSVTHPHEDGHSNILQRVMRAFRKFL